MDISETDQHIGVVSGIITALGAWIYCTAVYGFLFGFGLGWLPAAILGALVGFLMIYAWRIVVGLVVLLIVWALVASRH